MDHSAFSLHPLQGVCLYGTIHPMAPALQSEEMTLPSLQKFCLSALVSVCSVAGVGAARRLQQPPGCNPLTGTGWAHVCTGRAAAAPHHPAIPLLEGTLNLSVAIGKAEWSLKVAAQNSTVGGGVIFGAVCPRVFKMFLYIFKKI